MPGALPAGHGDQEHLPPKSHGKNGPCSWLGPSERHCPVTKDLSKEPLNSGAPRPLTRGDQSVCASVSYWDPPHVDGSRTSAAVAPATPRGTHSGSPGRSALGPWPRKPPAAGLAPGPPSCWRGSGAPWAAWTVHVPGVPSGALGRRGGQ